MPRVTGTLTQTALGLPIVSGADVSGAVYDFGTCAAARAGALVSGRRIVAAGKFWLWSGASTVTDDATEDAVAIQRTGVTAGRYLPEATQTSITAHLSDGTSAAVSGVTPSNTALLPSVVNGELTIPEVPQPIWQRFPTEAQVFTLCEGRPHRCSTTVVNALSAATGIFLLRQQDRYIDGGTGQVRSRAWNDSSKYLILGETGDACVQIPLTGNRGVKTAAGATSCVRIPNAYINPDGPFAITIYLAAIPGNTVSDRPLVSIGSMHSTLGTGRMVMRQNTDQEVGTYYCATYAALSTASIPPYAMSISALTGAGGLCTFYRDSGKITDAAKVAGTIYADDHVIGGWWDEAGGVWHSYAGFYIYAVVIHDRALTASEQTEINAAFVADIGVDMTLTLGQSNNAGVSITAMPEGIGPFPDHASAMHCTSIGQYGRGWGPLTGPLYSNIHGAAKHLKNFAFAQVTLGGSPYQTFYDLTLPNAVLLIEGLMASCYQLGCAINLKYIFIVGGESNADIAESAAVVRDHLIQIAARYRRSFHPNNYTNVAETKIIVSRLNSAYKLGIPAVALVQSGQALFDAADANSVVVDTDAFPLGADNIHYTGENRMLLGVAYALAALAP